MGRIFTILACGLILGPISAGVAQAQIDDHLKCYKIKDDLKAKTYKGFVDLDSPQFGLEPGCKLGKAKWFCVPVTKSNVQRKAKDPVDLLPIFGPPAPGDRICYKVNCTGPVPPNTTASDQFGTHNLTDFKAFMMCTPATKIFPPLCDQSGYPTCAGDCPDPNQTCHPADDGTTRCLCDEQCGFDAQGICGGDCPDPQVCDLVFDTVDPNTGIVINCQCVRDTVPVLCADTFPQCNGPCPNPDDDCVLVDTGTLSSPVIECRCEPSIKEPLCEDSFDACDGDCPPDEDCVVVFDSADPQNAMPIDCRCEPSIGEPLCEDTFPVCDGDCPEPDVCVTFAEQCDDGNLNNTDTCCNDCTGPPCDPLLDPPPCVGGVPNGIVESDCTCGCVPLPTQCLCDGVPVGVGPDPCTTQSSCGPFCQIGETPDCLSFDCPSLCGNGTLELFCCEECEDGNTTSGDGCSASCQAE